MRGLTVKDAMVSWDKVTVFSRDTKLTQENLKNIYSAGFSRIPVCRGDPQTPEHKNDVVGMCLVKVQCVCVCVCVYFVFSFFKFFVLSVYFSYTVF